MEVCLRETSSSDVQVGISSSSTMVSKPGVCVKFNYIYEGVEELRHWWKYGKKEFLNKLIERGAFIDSLRIEYTDWEN